PVGVLDGDRPGRVEPIEVIARERGSRRLDRLAEQVSRGQADVGLLESCLIRAIETGLELRQDLRYRAARVSHLAVGGPCPMEMPVDDAGHDHASPEIDDLGLGPDVRLRLPTR